MDAPDAGHWDLGWEALVAVGTIGLAAVTAWLAWTTRTVARATAAEIAGSWRPLLVFQAIQVDQLGDDRSERGLILTVRNDGRGPALTVVASTGRDVRSGLKSAVQGLIPVGLQANFAMRIPLEVESSYALSIDYLDLAGRLYSSEMVVEVPTPDLALEPGHSYSPPGTLVRQRFFEGRPLVRDPERAALLEPFEGTADRATADSRPRRLPAFL